MHPGPQFPPPRFGHPHIKVCGLRRVKDALEAATLGASFLGVVLARNSRRAATRDEARAISRSLRELSRRPLLAGVFSEEPAEEIEYLLNEIPLDYVQIHGPTENILRRLGARVVVPAFAVSVLADTDPAVMAPASHPAIVLDTRVPGEVGGTGKLFDHALATHVIATRRTFLAGGLNPENIRAIVSALQKSHSLPYGFDLSSGIESEPGVKDSARMRSFFQRAWERAE